MRILRPIVQALVLAMFQRRPIFALAAPYERGLSVIITRGGVTADFKIFFMSRCVARVSLRRWTKTSSTKPF